jgi:hypothetical protein
MATILDKDITRETKVLIDGREIQITLTEAQTINMRLKGMKSGAKEIGIEELYNQLSGVVNAEGKTGEKSEVKEEPNVEIDLKNKVDLSEYKGDSKFLISLHDIRHAMMVKSLDFNVKIQFEAFLVELIKERKKRK